jgi:hypothetical protein
MEIFGYIASVLIGVSLGLAAVEVFLPFPFSSIFWDRCIIGYRIFAFCVGISSVAGSMA